MVAAAYLAKAGARVVVCEARHKTGGAATDAPWPDHPEFRVTTLSYVMSLMPDRIVRDLQLQRHGYRVHPVGPYVVPFEDGRVLVEHEDRRRTYDEMARFSKADADALERWDAWIGGLAAVLGPLLMTTPPKLGSKRPAGSARPAAARLALAGLDVRTVAEVTRLLTMSIADIVSRFFESDQARTVMAIDGLIGTWAGPFEPGTAYVMAHHSIGDVGDGTLGSWGVPEGGMGAVAAAIEASARSLGSPHERAGGAVSIRDGRATGVVLEGGEELHAPIIVTACHPTIAFLRQIPREAPRDFVDDIEGWSSRSGVVKINLAVQAADAPRRPRLDGLLGRPRDRALPRLPRDRVRGGPARRPGSSSVQRRRDPDDPGSDACPGGIHVVSLFTQWVPSGWADEPHPEELERYADRVVDEYDEAVAPGFRGSIVARQVIGPYEMEHEWHLVGGNIFHGELSADQLFHMRPAPGYADYRTPIRELYQCSSATHAGGGVCGIPAYNCVREPEGPATPAEGGSMREPYSFTFYVASWYRKSPYWQRTVEAGCTSWDLYNHMLIRPCTTTTSGSTGTCWRR